jgi:hypothetical protein
VVVLPDVYSIQRQRNGFGRWRVGPRGQLSPFRLATQIKKETYEVFHVFSANAEVDGTLLTALDLEPNGFAVRSNIAYDLKHNRPTLARRLLIGAQSGLLEARPPLTDPADLFDADFAPSRLSFRSRVHELLCLETYGPKLDTSVIYTDIQRVHVELGPNGGRAWPSEESQMNGDQRVVS